MEEHFLQGQEGKTYFTLPPAWKVLNKTTIVAKKASQSVSQLVSKSLMHPVGAPPLQELVRGKRKVAVIVDDPARPTPKRAILTPLLDHLRQCGLRNDQITVIIALGTHGPLPESEIKEVYGEDICRNVKVVSHNCHADDLVSIGVLKHAGELKINRIVADADLRIAVGSVLPHPFAGFGGGAKAVLPGIAGYESVRNHHIALMLAEGVFVGNTENNPFLEDIRDAGRLAKLDFIVNAVYDADEEVKDIVAGHFIDAHNAGAETCAKELGVHYDQWADVTLMSAFPYTDGPQVLKPLATSNAITKKGGTVILYASHIKGDGFAPSLLQIFDAAFAKGNGNTGQLVIDHIRDHKPIVPGIPMDFNSALNMTLLYVSRTRMILVSRDADPKQAARLGFEYANSVQGAIEKVVVDLPNATVNILPLGGVVMPIVPQHMRTKWMGRDARFSSGG